MAFWGRRVLNFTPLMSKIPSRCYAAAKAVEQNSADKIDLEEAVAVVTGGASGIGFAIAREFLKEGMQALTIIDNDRDKGEKSIKKLAAEFGEEKLLFFEVDVANAEEMDNAFRKTVLHYDTIDIIVNNAGIMDDSGWELQLKTNLRGCVVGTLLGMQYMARTSSGEGGIIVNVASLAGVVPSSGFPVYTMTQFGIVGFTRALGCGNLYARTGVKVFGYCPGLTDTDMQKNIADKTINDNFAKEYVQEIDGCRPQKPETVAKNLVSILDEAKPGSLWVTENNRAPFELKSNDYSAEPKKKKTKLNGDIVIVAE